MITALHPPSLTKSIDGSMMVSGDLIVCDPYCSHETESPIRDVLAGRWVGQTALYKEAVDCFSIDIQYFKSLALIEAIKRKLSKDTAKAIFGRYGSPAHFYTLYSDASKVIVDEIENGSDFIQLIDELTAEYTPPKGHYIESFKFLVLAGSVKFFKESYYDLDFAQEELSRAEMVRNDPKYAKVQYLHLKHENAYQYTPHDADRWEQVSYTDTSSGKIALFNDDWFYKNNETPSSTANEAEKLCVGYEKDTFINIKKIGLGEMGVCTVTPLREQNEPIFAIFQEGKIVELLIHFDEDLGLDD